MTEATRQRVLLLRRAGMLWGIAHAAVHDVTRVERVGGRFRVRLAGRAGSAGEAGGASEELTADELVGVVDDLPVWPAGGVMARYWSEPVGGLTVHAATPMVMVDPARPPSFLRPDEETERADGDDR